MKRVLVVDDDDDIRELLRQLLEFEGYEVQALEDGAAAVEFLEAADAPWAVLLDIAMPRLSGFDVCKRLANMGTLGSRHKVALMTAGLWEARDCPHSVCTVLRKPFNLQVVLGLVANLTTANDDPENHAA